MGALLERYEGRIARDVIQADAAQAEAAAQLDDLVIRLGKAGKGGWFSKPDEVTGLYLWGGVGRGKSMLMDMFFDAAPVKAKQRVHFHAFMRDVHNMIGAWRKLSPAERKRSEWRVKGAGDDPIAPVAKQIAESAHLLCFDEFQVKQIADAMILSRLFEALFARGVTVVATSNRHPDDLYTHGISRELFLPFIELLKIKCSIFELVTDRDYRLERLTEAPVWYSPLGMASGTAMEDAWNRLTLNAAARPCEVLNQGRSIPVPAAAAGVARFHFDDLCDKPLGAADYIAVAEQFHTVMVSSIPRLTPDRRDVAKRFTALIDALYEAKVNLVASAEAEPDDLYPDGDNSFEFQRTASRLHEMRSADYLGEAHISPEAQQA